MPYDHKVCHPFQGSEAILYWCCQPTKDTEGTGALCGLAKCQHHLPFDQG